MGALIGLLSVPLVILNFLGGIVSGIWLALLGQWWAIGIGILGLFVSQFFIGIALAPTLALIVPMAALLERGKFILAIPLVLLNVIYTYGVISAWCLFVFYLFTHNATPQTFVPLVIWSYGVATGPWASMAQAEQQGGSAEGSVIPVFAAKLAFLAVGITAIFTQSSPIVLTELFGGIMALVMMFHFVLNIANFSRLGA